MNSTATSLSAVDREALEHDSWIDSTTADAFGLYRVSDREGAELVGRTDREDYAGIVFPVYAPGEERAKEYFLRRDHPPLELHNGKTKPKQKYLAPPRRGNRLLFGPGESVDVLADTALPIVLVEGLKKTLAAWRLSRHGDSQPGFLACGISGVWNWKGTIGKEPDATGARVDLKGTIPDFDRVTWTNRAVWLLFDSDAVTNPKVAAARKALVTELTSRGALVTAPDLPALEELDKTGFDDLLAHWGPERVLEWLASVQDAPPSAPIPLDEITLPDLPMEAFPDTLGHMIRAVAQATETPVELPALMGLATVAASCQRVFEVEMEPGYFEPLCVWVIAALQSGNRKTAVHMAMTAPLRKKERELCDAAKAKRLTVESTRATDEARVKSLRTSLANSEDFEHSEEAKQEIIKLETGLPAIPTIPSLWAQDVTPEKLGMLMADNGERLAILSDEGGFFDIIAGRYSSGIPNLDTCLQGHSCSPVKVNRGSRDELHMQRPTLTLGLSPQPSVLRDLSNKSILRDRGFLARVLFALPPSRLGFRTLVGKPVPSSVETAYHRMIEALLAFLPPTEDGQLAAHRLRPSPEAHREWKEFALTVERDMRPGARYEHMTDWAGKLPGAAVRVAGLFHCVQHAHAYPHDVPIDLATMQQALALLAILSAHALAVFDLMGADPALDGARRVWRWIDQGRRSTFTARECFQELRGTFHRMADLDQAFAVLCERSYLLSGDVPRTGPGRPSRPYIVSPTLTKGWV